MRDYAEAYRNFPREALEREVLKGRLDRGVNAAIECCDRWAGTGRIALEWMGGGARESLSFAELCAQSERFANLLIHDVVSEFSPPGSTGPVPTQTSSDAWKVASDQDQQQ